MGIYMKPFENYCLVYSQATEFYEAGMEAIMEKYFGDNDYIIEYQ
jgi:hypothetical protein|nr:MAG TPA: hypothetical protein [Caudoviricetes sp.]